MSRLEKKCFYASAATHVALLSLLVLGPAFVLTKQKNLSVRMLTFIPSIATDQMVVGGGNPAALQTPEPASNPNPASAPVEPVKTASQPEMQPDTPKPVHEQMIEPRVESPKPAVKNRPEHPKRETKPPKTSDAKPLVEKPPRKIEPSFVESPAAQQTKRASRDTSIAKARAEAAARAQAWQQSYSSQVQKLGNQLSEGLSSGTSIVIPGPGGAAYANYGLIIEAIYGNAWIPPGDLNDDTGVVKARVVIRKDGSVAKTLILAPSRHRALNRSVERALEIRNLPPFPEGAKDNERSFIIDFDLKTKRLLGSG